MAVRQAIGFDANVAARANAVTEFRSQAARFCSLVEAVESVDEEQLLARFVTVLPSLYAAAVQLPSISPASDELPDQRPTREQWNAINERLAQALGDADVYWSTEAVAEEKREQQDRVVHNHFRPVKRRR